MDWTGELSGADAEVDTGSAEKDGAATDCRSSEALDVPLTFSTEHDGSATVATGWVGLSAAVFGRASLDLDYTPFIIQIQKHRHIYGLVA